MSTLLIILLILTVGSFFWLFIDLVNNYGYWRAPLAILIVIILIGWGTIGSVLPQTTKNIKVTSPVEIMKSSTTVFVEVDNKVWEFREHKDYVSINDSTLFYYEISYNMYNDETSKQLRYKN